MEPKPTTPSCQSTDLTGRFFMAVTRKSCLILTSFLASLLPFSAAATITHKLEINFSFDSSAVPDKNVSGYKLFASSNLVCEQDAPTRSSEPLVCLISLPGGTYPFTLAVAFDDGSQTPQSPPFMFTLNSDTTIHDITGDSVNDLEDIVKGLNVLTGNKELDVNSAADINGDGKIGIEEIISSMRTIPVGVSADVVY